MKDSVEVGLPSQNTFHFTPILVIKKLIKFQIRKTEISVSSGDSMVFCSAEYSGYLLTAVRAVDHKDI